MRRSLELVSLTVAVCIVGTDAYATRELLSDALTPPCAKPVAFRSGCGSCERHPFLIFSSHIASVTPEEYAFLTLGMGGKSSWTTDDIAWFLGEIGSSGVLAPDRDDPAFARRNLAAAVAAWGMERGFVPITKDRLRLAEAVRAFQHAAGRAEERPREEAP